MLAIDPQMPDQLIPTITAASMVVAVIQWLKETKLVPFISHNTAALNRCLGWFAALVSSVGLHYTYDASTGTLVLTGLTAGALAASAWATVQSYAAQWLIYKGIVKGPAQVKLATEAAGAAPGQTPVVPVPAMGPELPEKI